MLPSRVSRRASMRELTVMIWHPPRAITGSSMMDHARSFSVGAKCCVTTAASSGCKCTRMLCENRGIFRMQVHPYIARRHRQGCNGLPNDADDLRRIGFEFAAHDLPRQRHGQGEKLPLHVRIENVKWLGQVVKHARQPVHLCLNFGAPRFAALGQALLERLFVRFRLQIGETTHGGHPLLGGRALHVGCRPQCNSRRRL